MANETVKIHKFSNGLTLVAEPMAEVSSGAFYLLLKGGVARDPEGRTGAASVLSELMFRGAGELDNRALSDKLDSLGVHRGSGVGEETFGFSGALLGDNLLEALNLYTDIVRRPHLDAKQFGLCKELALQSLAALDDDPRQKISMFVRENYLPYPYGRPSVGKKDDLLALTAEDVQAYWKQSFGPEGAVLAVAGQVDFETVKAEVEQLLGDWDGGAATELSKGDVSPGMYHEGNEGAQVHVGVLYRSVTQEDPDYYAALAAAAVLSGGMGSRLFTEVREKRGLCYAVGASHRVFGPYGTVACYLGSTPDNAQEALDVTLSECQKLSDGITEDELDRAKVGLRASMIMQGESTMARANSCASDMFRLGRVRSLEEIEAAVQGLTVEDVVGYAGRYKPEAFGIGTIGPKGLTQ